MAYISEDLVIDISRPQSFRYLQAKQYDHNSRERRLIITNSGIPIKLDGTEYITLSLSLKGDNYSNTSCPFKDDGYPYIIFTDAMLSRAGDVDCEIRIFSRDESIITTFNFKTTISKSLLNHDRIIKSSEFDTLNTLILQAVRINDLIKEYETNKVQIDRYINQVKADIDSYQSRFTDISTDANALITELRTFISNAKIQETGRVDAEKLRVTAESKRADAETTRIASEQTRVSAENSRKSAESARAQAEDGRKSSETARSAAETHRNNAESARATAETSRSNAESERGRNEVSRINAETTRSSAEINRISAETGRVSAESARTAAETERQTNTAIAIANAEAATSGAITATQNAIKATSDTESTRQQALEVINSLRYEINDIYGGNATEQVADNDLYGGGA